MATLNPTIRFEMVGNDKASAKIKGVRREIDRTTKSIGSASTRLSGLRNGFSSLASGDVSGALSSLSAGLGKTGIAGKAALATTAVGAIGVVVLVLRKCRRSSSNQQMTCLRDKGACSGGAICPIR